MRIRSRTWSSSLGACSAGVFASRIGIPFLRPACAETMSYRTAGCVIHLPGWQIYTYSGVYFTLAGIQQTAGAATIRKYGLQFRD